MYTQRNMMHAGLIVAKEHLECIITVASGAFCSIMLNYTCLYYASFQSGCSKVFLDFPPSEKRNPQDSTFKLSCQEMKKIGLT